ncbi:hypothetical protein Tco_1192040 [Tanacetum coccineum]
MNVPAKCSYYKVHKDTRYGIGIHCETYGENLHVGLKNALSLFKDNMVVKHIVIGIDKARFYYEDLMISHQRRADQEGETFETDNDEHTRISIIVNAIKNRAERDPVKNMVENQEGDAVKNVVENSKRAHIRPDSDPPRPPPRPPPPALPPNLHTSPTTAMQ